MRQVTRYFHPSCVLFVVMSWPMHVWISEFIHTFLLKIIKQLLYSLCQFNRHWDIFNLRDMETGIKKDGFNYFLGRLWKYEDKEDSEEMLNLVKHLILFNNRYCNKNWLLWNYYTYLLIYVYENER